MDNQLSKNARRLSVTVARKHFRSLERNIGPETERGGEGERGREGDRERGGVER